MGHYACIGAKTDKKRKSLLTSQLCTSDCTASKTRMTTSTAPASTFSSVNLLLATLLSTDLDRRVFPSLLRLVRKEDGHRLCMGNWNSSQITLLDMVAHPTDSVQALSESFLAPRKHLVNRIYSIWSLDNRWPTNEVGPIQTTTP